MMRLFEIRAVPSEPDEEGTHPPRILFNVVARSEDAARAAYFELHGSTATAIVACRRLCEVHAMAGEPRRFE